MSPNEELTQVISDQRQTLRDLTSALQDVAPLLRAANSNSARVSINAGGFGVWVAATCCLVMLAANVFLAALVIDHNRQISDLNDYLQVIYQVAPHLKPQES